MANLCDRARFYEARAAAGTSKIIYFGVNSLSIGIKLFDSILQELYKLIGLFFKNVTFFKKSRFGGRASP